MAALWLTAVMASFIGGKKFLDFRISGLSNSGFLISFLTTSELVLVSHVEDD